jgi:hypothetical protein
MIEKLAEVEINYRVQRNDPSIEFEYTTLYAAVVKRQNSTNIWKHAYYVILEMKGNMKIA